MKQYEAQTPEQDKGIREAVRSPLYKDHIVYSGPTVTLQMLVEFTKL